MLPTFVRQPQQAPLRRRSSKVTHRLRQPCRSPWLQPHRCRELAQRHDPAVRRVDGQWAAAVVYASRHRARTVADWRAVLRDVQAISRRHAVADLPGCVIAASRRACEAFIRNLQGEDEADEE